MKKIIFSLAATLLSFAQIAPAGAIGVSIHNTGPGSHNVVSLGGWGADHVVRIRNNNNVSFSNYNSQVARSGDAIVSGNTYGGDAHSGDATNTNHVSFHVANHNGSSYGDHEDDCYDTCGADESDDWSDEECSDWCNTGDHDDWSDDQEYDAEECDQVDEWGNCCEEDESDDWSDEVEEESCDEGYYMDDRGECCVEESTDDWSETENGSDEESCDGYVDESGDCCNDPVDEEEWTDEESCDSWENSDCCDTVDEEQTDDWSEEEDDCYEVVEPEEDCYRNDDLNDQGYSEDWSDEVCEPDCSDSCEQDVEEQDDCDYVAPSCNTHVNSCR